jgi:hypothetical protein
MQHTHKTKLVIYVGNFFQGDYRVYVRIEGFPKESSVLEEILIPVNGVRNQPKQLNVWAMDSAHRQMVHAQLARVGITQSTRLTARVESDGADRGNTHPSVSRLGVQYRLKINFHPDGRFLSMCFHNRLPSDVALLESVRRKLLACIALRVSSTIAQYIQWILGPV